MKIPQPEHRNSRLTGDPDCTDTPVLSDLDLPGACELLGQAHRGCEVVDRAERKRYHAPAKNFE